MPNTCTVDDAKGERHRRHEATLPNSPRLTPPVTHSAFSDQLCLITWRETEFCKRTPLDDYATDTTPPTRQPGAGALCS